MNFPRLIFHTLPNRASRAEAARRVLRRELMQLGGRLVKMYGMNSALVASIIEGARDDMDSLSAVRKQLQDIEQFRIRLNRLERVP